MAACRTPPDRGSANSEPGLNHMSLLGPPPRLWVYSVCLSAISRRISLVMPGAAGLGALGSGVPSAFSPLQRVVGGGSRLWTHPSGSWSQGCHHPWLVCEPCPGRRVSGLRTLLGSPAPEAQARHNPRRARCQLSRGTRRRGPADGWNNWPELLGGRSASTASPFARRCRLPSAARGGCADWQARESSAADGSAWGSGDGAHGLNKYDVGNWFIPSVLMLCAYS